MALIEFCYLSIQLGFVCVVLKVLEMTSGMQFSQSSTWKPVQTGMKLSTTSVLDLHKTLVVTGGLKFLLTSRLNQDALENVFSQVRGKGDTHPSVVSFRYNLRAICLSQFMSVPKTASYHPDHTPHLLDLLSHNTNKSKSGDSRIDFEDIESDVVNNLATTAIVNIDFVDKNVVSYIGGWVAFKLKSLLKDCGECCDSLTSTSSVDDDLKLTVVKSRGGLSIPSRQVVDLLLVTENIFRNLGSELLQRSNIVDYVVGKVLLHQVAEAVELPECHNLKQLVLHKYVRLRLHAHAAALSKAQTRQFASKSAAARTIIK